MKKIFIIVLFAFCSLFLICGCISTDKKENFTVTFILDGEIISTTTIEAGSAISEPDIPQQEGYVFKGWFLSEDYNDKWNFSLSTVSDNLFLYGFSVEKTEATFSVLFYDGLLLAKSLEVSYGSEISDFIPTANDGYIFDGWYINDVLYDLSLPLYNDITLTAKWTPITYYAEFIADGITIDKADFTVEDTSINIPEIPSKPYYSAAWETFELGANNIIIKAIFIPIEYTATYLIGENVFKQFIYTVEDYFPVPEIPEKAGYSALWSEPSAECGDITINAEYTLIEYNVAFVVDDEILDIITYTIENKQVTLPLLPERPGYKCYWEEFDLTLSNIVVCAMYEIIDYRITFIAENKIIDCITFNVEHLNIVNPQIPDKYGYSAIWEPYEVSLNDFTVKAVYSAITYSASFILDEKEIAVIEFTVEDETINSPTIDQIQGYNIQWENYIITANNLVINAVYQIIPYKITFVADGTEISNVIYTIENTEITEPTVPLKDGFIAAWEDYSLNFENIIVNAIYTPVTPTDTEPNEPDIPTIPDKPEISTPEEPNEPNEPALPDISDTPDYPEEPEIPSPEEPDESDEPDVPEIPDEPEIVFKDEFTYTTNSDGTLTVTEYYGSDSYVIIPNEHDGKKVKAIADYAFLASTTITNVKICNGIEHIGAYSFMGCTELTSIILPESITSIGECAFAYSGLSEINLPDAINEIGKQAFAHCNLSQISLPHSLTRLENIFYYCSSLTQLYIPNNVTFIADTAFEGCENLLNVIFENTASWNIYNSKNQLILTIDCTDLCKGEVAANYLKSYYVNYIWKYEY